jgi:PleD family two-component response regulator
MSENKLKILLADDDENIRTMYAEIFAKEGFEVEEAVDGLEGLEKATKNTPDIIFTGIIMPRMDGFALIESLKKNVATANIPIFMSSHMGRKEDQDKAREAGVKEFFVVGMIPPRQVVARVRAILKGGSRYLLKFDPKSLDAGKLSSDLNLSDKNFFCPKCGSDMSISLEIIDIPKQEFKAKFVCPSCS